MQGNQIYQNFWDYSFHNDFIREGEGVPNKMTLWLGGGVTKMAQKDDIILCTAPKQFLLFSHNAQFLWLSVRWLDSKQANWLWSWCGMFSIWVIWCIRYQICKKNTICYRSPSMNHSAHNMDFKMGRSVTKTRKPFPKAQKHTVSQRWRVNHIIDKISCIFLKNSQNRLQTFVTIKKLFPKIDGLVS